MKILAIFSLLGPPAGTLTIFAVVGALDMVQTGDLGGLVWISLFGLIYGVPAGYLMGIAPAAAAGAILAAYSVAVRPPGLLFAGATGTGVGLAMVSLGGRNVGQLVERPFTDTLSILLLPLAALVATLVCWAIARPAAFSRRQSAGG